MTQHDETRWPASPALFVDTSRCPSCFAAVVASVCPVCALDLTDPRTADVLEVSRRLVALVDERASVLRRVRADADEAARRVVSEAATAGASPSPLVPPVAVSSVATAGAGHVGAGAVLSSGPPRGVAPAAAGRPPARPALPPDPVPPRAAPAPVLSPTPTGQPVIAPAGPAPKAGPRRSGVQVFLLSVGVVLLAVAAVFFLTVAWVNGGIALRSVVIGLVTAAIIATASLLRRRRLTATSEGIAALGIAFVALDAWAVRANDLAGTASTDARTYWGVAALAVGAACVGWARLSSLRSPLSSGIVALALAPGLVAAGIVDTPGASSWYAFGLGALVVTLGVPVLARPGAPGLRVEIAVVRGLALAAAVVATGAALVLRPDDAWAPTIAAGVVALLLAAHAVLLVRADAARLAPVVAASAVAVLTAGIAITTLRLADAVFAATAPVLVAALIALGLEALAARMRAPAARVAVSVAAVVAGVGAVIAALPAVLVSLGGLLDALGALFPLWQHDPLVAISVDATSRAGVLALAGAVGLAVLVWRLTGRGAVRVTASAGAVAAVALLAGPQLRVPFAIVAWYVVLAAVCVWLLRSRRLTGVAAVTVVGAAGLAWVLSFASFVTWIAATAATVVVLLALAPVARALRMAGGVASVLFVAVNALMLPAALRAAFSVAIAGVEPLPVAALAAAVCLVVAALPARSSTAAEGPVSEAPMPPAAVSAERPSPPHMSSSPSTPPTPRAAPPMPAAAAGVPPWPRGDATAADVSAAGAFATTTVGRESAAVTAVSVLAVAFGSALSTRTPSATTFWLAVAAAVAVVVTALVVLVGGRRGWRAGRPVAATVTAPFAAFGAQAVAGGLGASIEVRCALAASAALVVASLALAVLRSDQSMRVLVDAGAAVALAVAVAVGGDGLPWLIAAVVAVVWSVDTDGVFVSRSPRRHLVWLALLLAAVALWTRLGDQRVEAVEPYTLPVAGGLVVLAVLIERARRLVPGRPVATPAVVLFAATALALVPTSLGDPAATARASIVALVSFVLVVAGAWVRLPRTPELLPLAIAAAAAVALIVGLAIRLADVLRGGPDRLVDAAVAFTAVAFVAAATGLARRPSTARGGEPVFAGGAGVFAVGATVVIGSMPGSLLRVVVAVAALGLTAVGCVRSTRPPLGPVAGVTALSGAALVAVVAVAVGVRPVEAATLPVALALLAIALLLPASRTGVPTGAPAHGVASPSPVPLLSRERFAPVVWGAGLVAALAPSVAFVHDDSLRAVVVAGVAVLLLVLVAGAARRASGRVATFRFPTFAVAGLALVSVVVAQAGIERQTPVLDAWLLVGVVPLVAVATLLRRAPIAGASWASDAAVLAALALGAGLSLIPTVGPGDPTIRVLVTIVAILVVGVCWQRPLVSWAAIAIAAAFGAVALVGGRVDPLEAVTAPVAAALLVRGAVALQRDTTARSWPTLGPGLGLLLVPSLFFDLSAHNTVWRAIALGLVALGVLLAGARLRLQSAVLLGGLALLVHGVAQLWPGITAIYEQVSGLWWLWLGIAGVLLIVVAATYERRIRELRAAVLAIRGLR